MSFTEFILENWHVRLVSLILIYAAVIDGRDLKVPNWITFPMAFCAEMTRLPGHCAPRLTPVNATAQTTPSRSTIVPHMFIFRPLPSALVASDSAFFRSA